MSKHELEPAEQKPAAWIIRHPRFCGKFTDDKEISEHWENKEQGCTAPLFLHPQPAPDVTELLEALTPQVLDWMRCGLAANGHLRDGDHPALAKLRAAIASSRIVLNAAYRQQGGEA